MISSVVHFAIFVIKSSNRKGRKDFEVSQGNRSGKFVNWSFH